LPPTSSITARDAPTGATDDLFRDRRSHHGVELRRHAVACRAADRLDDAVGGRGIGLARGDLRRCDVHSGDVRWQRSSTLDGGQIAVHPDRCEAVSVGLQGLRDYLGTDPGGVTNGNADTQAGLGRGHCSSGGTIPM
jgi:hypothetical protein